MQRIHSESQLYRLVPASDPVGPLHQPDTDPAQAPPSAPPLAPPTSFTVPPTYVVKEYTDTLKPPAQVPTPPPARPQPKKPSVSTRTSTALQGHTTVSTEEQSAIKTLVCGNNWRLRDIRRVISDRHNCLLSLVILLIIVQIFTLAILLYSVFWKRRHAYV